MFFTPTPLFILPDLSVFPQKEAGYFLAAKPH